MSHVFQLGSCFGILINQKTDIIKVVLLALATSLFASCRTPRPCILPEKMLAPDVVASVRFRPGSLRRVGVLPFAMGEGPPWEEDYRGTMPGPVDMDAAERFSASIARVVDCEVIPPARIASLLPGDMVEVTTRKQVAELCRELGLDAVFRGRMGMVIERASIGSGEVIIPFAFVTLEVELMDAGSGEVVWFANHDLNSFQFMKKKINIDTGNTAAVQKLLAENIPGYPDTIATLTILAELVVAEIAESFYRSCSNGGD